VALGGKIFIFLSSVAYSLGLKGLNTAHQDFYILRRYVVGHVVVVIAVYENYVKKCLNYTHTHTHTHLSTRQEGSVAGTLVCYRSWNEKSAVQLK